ncbi:YccF domain-containing protein [bacterium]|nr:YccF domain-containing protein [bacterium]
MGVIGNIIWFIFGGFIGGLLWCLAGLLCFVTIIGIPVGLQCFKFADVFFFPFGKEIDYGGSTFSFLVNIIWIICFGWELALSYLCAGLIFCVTIIGIPFGLQFFKLAKLAFLPFGATVTRCD